MFRTTRKTPIHRFQITGANIDKGHHANRARYALEEGLEFDNAVAKVMEMTSTDDTLVVVSADHSHAFSFGGKQSKHHIQSLPIFKI